MFLLQCPARTLTNAIPTINSKSHSNGSNHFDLIVTDNRELSNDIVKVQQLQAFYYKSASEGKLWLVFKNT